MKTCPAGHPKTPENTRPGRTDCKICHRDRQRARADAKRGGPPPKPDPERYPCGHLRTVENARPGRGDCATCHRESQKARYRADPERHRAISSAYAKAHRDRVTEYHRAWRVRAGDAYRAKRAQITRTKRLARKDVDTRDWISLLSLDPCSYCGAPVEHIDHIVPRVVGGPNHWSNYTGACARCNLEKNAKPLLTFLLEHPIGSR